MALVLELNATLMEIASALGANTTAAAQLEAAGVTVDVKPKSVIFLHGGGVIATAGLALGPLKTVLSGKGSPTTKAIMMPYLNQAMTKALAALDMLPKSIKDIPNPNQSIADDVQDAIAKAAAEIAAKTLASATSFITVDEAKSAVMKEYAQSKYMTQDKVAAIKLLRALAGIGLKEAKDQVEVWIGELSPMFSADNTAFKPVFTTKKAKVKGKVAAMNLPMVKLSEATEIYQPVQGSGGSSKYHAIAIGKDLKVGIRVKPDGNVSFRVEGNIDQYAERLQEAGLDLSGDHYSTHMKVQGKPMIRKVIGAMLSAIHYPFDEFTVRIDKLIGQGA